MRRKRPCYGARDCLHLSMFSLLLSAGNSTKSARFCCSFWAGLRLRAAENCRFPCKIPCLQGIRGGDGCDQHCIASQNAHGLLSSWPIAMTEAPETAALNSVKYRRAPV